jgi:hypothetical protein
LVFVKKYNEAVITDCNFFPAKPPHDLPGETSFKINPFAKEYITKEKLFRLRESIAEKPDAIHDTSSNSMVALRLFPDTRSPTETIRPCRHWPGIHQRRNQKEKES